MIDVNYPLRKAYYNALQATGLPVYYQSLPNNVSPDDYIVFRSINSGDASTKNSSDTSTTITVEIHTSQDVINRGKRADDIANEIYGYVYAISQFVLPMDGMQMVNTTVQSDIAQNFVLNNQKTYIARFITFRHNIFNGGTMSGLVATISNYSYTATGSEGDTVTIASLSGKKILMVSKDGITQAGIITTGTPTGKQVLYNSGTGSFTFTTSFEPNENLFIVYQNSN